MDIVALAQTGTGKTAAFGLPLLEKLKETAASRNTGALVLCPTRELAIQITNELQEYSARLPHMRIDAVYGGAGYGEQIRSLKNGVHILVATPGRLLDLIEKGKADLSTLEYLVLDEADIMLNMGFKEELDAILEALPATRRTLLLSATMPDEVALIASQYMKDPLTVTIGRRNAAAESVEHRYFQVHPGQKYAALKRLVDYHPDMYGIIFCRTKSSTQEIADRLIGDGYHVEALHGDLSQSQRELVMKKFRRKNLQLIVATDIAARGLDVQDLSHVIHYDLPDEIDMYTHRSGRTGRAGKSGKSYAIVAPREKRRLLHIEKTIRRSIHASEMPKGSDIFRNHLLDFADRLSSVEVDEKRIEEYLDAMNERLGDLSRDELLRKIVSLQFEDMIDYYRDVPDMHTARDVKNGEKRGKRPEASGKNGFGGRSSHGGRRSGHGGRGGRGGPVNRNGSGRYGVEEGYGCIRINLGKRDRVSPPDLIGLVNQSSRRRHIDIGRINIRDSWSSVQIDEEYAGPVADTLDGFTYRGRSVRAQLLPTDRG